MNRLIKTILLLLLCIGSASATVTQIDSIPNFVSAVYRGGTIFKVGVLTDYYGVLFSSTTTDNIVLAVTFSCTDAGALSANVIDTEVYVTGVGTGVGAYPAALQIPNTNYFLGSWSHVDSTWIYIFEIDTANGTFGGEAVIAEDAIKWAGSKKHTFLQIGSSDYFALAAENTSSSATWVKTFLIDPDTPTILDVTVDSLDFGSTKIIDIDRVASSDFYVVSTWGGYYTPMTYSISQEDGTIAERADIKEICVYNLPSPGNLYANTAHVNDTVFVGVSSQWIGSFSVNSLNGTISCSADSVVAIANNSAGIGPSIAANDSVTVAFYTDYWLDYDAYLASCSVNQVSGALTLAQPEIKAFSDNLTSDFFSSSRMLTRDSRKVLMVYRGASPFYGCIRTMEVTPAPYWGHERNGIAYPYLNSVDGVGIADILEVDGVEK